MMTAAEKRANAYAKARAMTAAERAVQAERLALVAKSPMRPKKDQAGHAETPLFQTTIEEFV